MLLYGKTVRKSFNGRNLQQMTGPLFFLFCFFCGGGGGTFIIHILVSSQKF